MIRFQIQKLAVTFEWKPRFVDRASKVRHNQQMNKAHETILDRQCGRTFLL
jgi:hypothetical protein